MTFKPRWDGGFLAVVVSLLFIGPAVAQAVPPLPSPPPQVNVGTPFQTLTTVYQEDFEADDGDYTVGGVTTWEHGIPDSPPVPVSGQGPNVWGTQLTGDYDLHECGWLQAPAVDLSAYPPGAASPASFAQLVFRHWYDIESKFDGAAVMASPDGENWKILTPHGGYDLSGYNSVRTCFGQEWGDPVYTNPSSRHETEPDAWKEAAFDVSEYLGGELHVRWAFASSGLGPARGWYVDDVQVQVGVGTDTVVPVPQAPEPSLAYTPAATLYAEDFEADDGGWTESGTGAWAWGAIESPPFPLGGVNAWATGVAADAPRDACSSLTSPAISLPGADPAAGIEMARLGFDLWRHLDSGDDGALLQVSVDDGATWQTVTPASGYDGRLWSADESVLACLGVDDATPVWTGPYSAPAADAWHREQVDLTPFLGEDVRLRFLFASGSDTVSRGAYVDDVIVTVGVGAEADAFQPEVPATAAPGWTITGPNPSWSYGAVTAGPASATPAWGTNLNGFHNVQDCGAIESPPIATSAVPGLGRLTLNFEHHLTTTYKTAGGVVQVSTDDGATWETVTPVGGYDDTLLGGIRACVDPDGTTSRGFTGSSTGPGFEAREVRLGAYDGEIIRVRFAFGSAYEYQNFGWYVRGVSISRGAGNIPLATAGDDPAALPAVGELAAKADDALRAALLEGDAARFSVIVTGPAHAGLVADAYPTREAALRALDASAAPFVDAVTGVVDAAGGDVVGSWSTAPAVKVVADAATLRALADLDVVKGLALDYDGAVTLVSPLPSDGDGVDAQNTQGRKMLQAEEAWDLGYRGEGIRIAVIDTGIDGRHEAFKNADGSSRIVGWKDFYAARENPYDDHGHGTHVAGSAAGSDAYDDPDYGRFQETGVAPEADLMGIKFLSAGGSGTLENAIRSLEWAFENDADLTSNSWGSSCSSASESVMQTVRTLTDLGMPSVFAAGNSGPRSGTIGGPACSEAALTVGAVNAAGDVAWFSSRGPCRDIETDGESRICPDVVAKGVAVRSAIPRDGAAAGDSSGYRTWEGTSMATPHVAGALALAEEMKRDLTGSGWNATQRMQERVFKLTAKDLGPTGEDQDYGWGLPQLIAIHDALQSTDEPRIVPDFGVSEDVLWYGDETTLSFSVENHAAAVADGTFRATLTAPDGSETVLRDEDVSLGLLDDVGLVHTFTVDRDTLQGAYAFEGSFEYAWTNETTGEEHTDALRFTDAFEVRRVLVDVSLDGLDGNALPLTPNQATVTVRNDGNEPSQATVVELTVPDDYVFVPGDGYDPERPLTRYGEPAPDRVHEDERFGRVTLTYEVGELAPGESFTFATNVAATTPGAYRSVAVAKFTDGVGNPFAASDAATQNVGVTLG